jgi:hypothetical protein
MGDLLKAIEGKRTYLGAALLAFAVFAYQINWIDANTFGKIQATLIAWIGATLRSAITKTASDK